MQFRLPHAQKSLFEGIYVDRMRLWRYGECGKQLLYCDSIALLSLFVKCFFEKICFFKKVVVFGKTFFFLFLKILDFNITI